jgi:tetratricopeptide (TPR) repeat protein
LAVEINPNFAEGYYNLGKALRCQSRIQAAIEAFAHAAKLSPEDSPFYHISHGHWTYLAGSWDQAAAAYQTAAQSTRDHLILTEAYHGWALALAEGKQDWTGVREILQRFSELVPRAPWPNVAIAKVAMAYGEYEEARQWYRLAVEAAPGDASLKLLLSQTYVTEGRAYARQQEWNRSIAAYEMAINTDPSNIDGYIGLGRMLWRRDGPTAAIPVFEDAIHRFPQLPDGHIWLAQVYQSLGNHDHAEAILTSASVNFPDVPEIYARLGVTYYAQKRLTLATNALEKAIHLQSDVAWYYKALGDLYKDLGRTDAAILAYRQALQLEPGLPEVQRALENLTKK